jgi:uncharacterized protein YkwD
MKLKLTVLAISATIALVGCGGGGGSSTAASPSSSVGTAPTTPTTPAVPATPAPDPTALQADAGTSTYAAGSIELSALNTLNQARAAYGVGQLVQNAQLDTAAQNHATYINNRFQAGDYAAAGHLEDATKAGFTGVNPADRILFAKYAAALSGETLSSIIAVDGVTSDPGVVSVTGLLSGPYHRFSMFDGYREVGFGHGSIRTTTTGGTQNTVVADYGVNQASQAQSPASGWIGTWPMDNATGVLYSFAGESPDPIPVNQGACAGYPVSLQVRAGVTLATTAFTLTEAATGAAVNVQLSTAATDQNPNYARANTAYIIPFKPLKLGTKYTVHFVGTQNGAAIDKTWSFTTRTDNVKMVFGCDPS